MQTSLEDTSAREQAPAVAWTPAPKDDFLVRPRPSALRKGFVRLRMEVSGGSERLCIAPAIEGAPLLASARGGQVFVEPDEAQIEPAGWPARLKALAPSAAKSALRFDALELRPLAAPAPARAYRKLVKFARVSGFAFDGETMRRRPELVEGWAADDSGAAPRTRDGLAVAVALHLHYVELWPEIRLLLRRWRRPFALLVSLTRRDDALARTIRADFPSAEVEWVENSGRDIRPFLAWLESGRLDAFDLVCKIHGKRSLRDGVSPLFGELFRRASFLDLISDDARVDDICTRFAVSPRVGLIGPARFRAASRHGDPREIMGASRHKIEALGRDMGAAEFGADYDVFHGSMFWVRPQALKPLRDLGLAKESFASEAGLSDGALEHAVEGLFNHAARAAGFAVEGTTAP